MQKTKSRFLLFRQSGNLTEGPILPKLLLFTVPLILTSVINLLFNTADTLVVGRYGGETVEECETALAAVGSCGSLINLICGLFLGLSTGSSVGVAKAAGAGEDERIGRITHTSVLLALASGVIVSAIGIIFAGTFLSWMGPDPAVLREAVPYLRAYFVGAIANMVYNFCAAILRSLGDTVRPFIFLSAGGVVNIGLNLLMVLVFKLGALGVGIATAASLWMSCLLIVLYMSRMKGPARLSWKKLRVDVNCLRDILRIGIPAGLQGCVFSISNVAVQSAVNSLGKTVMAAHASASNLLNYLYNILNAFYHATITFVGQHLGAGKYGRMKKCILLNVICVAVIGATLGLLMAIAGRPLLGLFIHENEPAIEAGMTKLWLEAPLYFICGLMEIGCACVRSFGKSVTSTVTSVIGSCLFRLVWIETVFKSSPSVFTLQLLYPISWAITATAHFCVFFFLYRKFKKDHPTA